MRNRSQASILLAVFLLALALPLIAQPASRPARRYLVRGTLQAISASSVTVKGYDRHKGSETTRTLKVDSSSQVEDGLKVGDSVVADYNYTMDNNVYKLVSVRKQNQRRKGRR